MCRILGLISVFVVLVTILSFLQMSFLYPYTQDGKKLVYPKDLPNLEPYILKNLEYLSDPETDKTEYIQYEVLEERSVDQEYDLVKDEYGFVYKIYPCEERYFRNLKHRKNNNGLHTTTFHIWHSLLSVWNEYAKLLEIEYYLFFGGILGMVRDGEPIPWDEDIDMIINMEDIQKVMDHVPRNPINGWYVVIHPEYKREWWGRSRYKCYYYYYSSSKKKKKRITKEGYQLCWFKYPIMRFIHFEYLTYLEFYGFVKLKNYTMLLDKPYADVYKPPESDTITTSDLDLVMKHNEKFNHESTTNNVILVSGRINAGKSGGHYFYRFDEEKIFGSSHCEFFGVHVPCPSERKRVVETIYGKDWGVRSHKCNEETGSWRLSKYWKRIR